MNAAGFYCVADEPYFLGAVALVNSLRLHGHREPVYVLDRGLRPDQRELLAPQAELIPADPGQPPWLQKAIAPLARPSETMVLIDADMIVTRSLGELIDRMRGGEFEVTRNPYAALCFGCPAAARLCPRPAWKPSRP